MLAFSFPHPYLRHMFKSFRRLSGALQGLTSTLESVSTHLTALLAGYDTQGSLEQRLQALESSRSMWEAEIAAEFVKAESQFKAARASEERSRTMMKHARALAGSEDGEDRTELESITELLKGHADALAEIDKLGDPLQEVSASVVVDGKDVARRAKWGV